MKKTHIALGAAVLLIVGTAILLLAVEIPTAHDATLMMKANLPGPFGIWGRVPSSRVRVDIVLDQYLYRPLALAFDPFDMSLWVVNHDNDSSIIIDNALGHPSSMKVTRFFDKSKHFMRRPTSITFSFKRNEMVTTQETVNDYAKSHAGLLFMGPTLFTADRKIYEGGNHSHLDMLHHSPLGMGSALGANEDCREYWIFNGFNSSIDQYCFWEPHVLGGIDHSDGLTIRHGAGQVKRREGVPSHMQFDRRSEWLYIADTGNGRVVKLNTKKFPQSEKKRQKTKIRETVLWELPNSKVEPFTTDNAGLVAPSGLLLVDEQFLVVGDYATGHLKAFSLSGEMLGDVDTGLGPDALAGLAVPVLADSIQSGAAPLFAVDSKRNRVVRITILPRSDNGAGGVRAPGPTPPSVVVPGSGDGEYGGHYPPENPDDGNGNGKHN